MNKNEYKDLGIDLSLSEFSILADIIPAFITVYDRECNILFANKTLVEELCYETRSHLLGSSLLDLVNDNPQRILEKVEHVVEYGESEYAEFELFCNDGRIIIVEARGFVVNWQGSLALMSVARNITKIKELHSLLSEIHNIVEAKNTALAQKMFDLNILMGEVELHKKNTEDKIISNVETTILPILKKIKTQPESKKYISLLEKNLNNLTSEFGSKIASKLSPREREVMTFIKEGLTNKEIATVLNLSIRTIDRHRQAIREKLNLNKSGVSLNTWLQDNS